MQLGAVSAWQVFQWTSQALGQVDMSIGGIITGVVGITVPFGAVQYVGVFGPQWLLAVLGGCPTEHADSTSGGAFMAIDVLITRCSIKSIRTILLRIGEEIISLIQAWKEGENLIILKENRIGGRTKHWRLTCCLLDTDISLQLFLLVCSS
jgi:hypothetical protein